LRWLQKMACLGTLAGTPHQQPHQQHPVGGGSGGGWGGGGHIVGGAGGGGGGPGADSLQVNCLIKLFVSVGAHVTHRLTTEKTLVTCGCVARRSRG